MLSSYLALDRRAVLDFFNPCKSEQFVTNYFHTITSLRAHDQHSTKCFRSIHFLLVFEAFVQVCLYLCPFRWHRLACFDIFDSSNNYPNSFRLNMSAVLLGYAYMVNTLYVDLDSQKCYLISSGYYLNDHRTFVRTASDRVKKYIVVVLNAYQFIPFLTVLYLCLEYISFTMRIFRSDSLLVWTEWAEFVTMNIFFVAFASAFCLVVSISLTCIACTVLSLSILYFRFRETQQPLSYPYCRLSILRMLRFVDGNIHTMQYFFSLNRFYGSNLLAFMLANLPWNVMIVINLLQNQFSVKQALFISIIFLGQQSCLIGMHLVAAVVSKKIHSPYKRVQSLNILIRRCPLRARIHLANAIQAFHVNGHKYGITYGTGKWTFGLVTMMSFAKFIFLYGEQLMYQYHHLKH